MAKQLSTARKFKMITGKDLFNNKRQWIQNLKKKTEKSLM